MDENFSWVPKAGDSGIPMTVVATRGDMVDIEGPSGENMTVPLKWFAGKVDPTKQHSFSHLDLSAPPGELEKLWQQAEAEFFQKDDPLSPGYLAPGAAPDKTNLDLWTERQGGFGGTDVWAQDGTVAQVPSTTVKDAAYAGNAWAPPVGSQELRNKNLEIPPDDHRFGEWDEEWDPKRKKWVKRKD